MENFQVYRDIQSRTGGDIYIGVVGPVRTGKSTFIRRFMEVVALPQMSESRQAEIRDQLPLSGSGKIITTVETKFIPKEAIPITLGEDQKVKIRLIDSVGFLVKDASGHTEEGKERMIKTPWFEQAIPFREAARIGTQKVIEEHSTIGIVITSDGSFGELPRENFVEAEEKTIQELKKQQKPFIVLVNSQMPYKDEALKTAKVKGRIEMIKVSDEFTLMIDYAHNAMALESLLTTLREYNPHRLVCLFGCGGNRSRDRRFEMGEVSGKLADLTIITSDNPRNEEPQAIIDDIKTGISKTDGKYVEIIDRKEAIAYAIHHGEPGDIVILAGKGHEDYQEIKGKKYPMDERVLIAEILEEDRQK